MQPIVNRQSSIVNRGSLALLLLMTGLFVFNSSAFAAQRPRARDFGIRVGTLPPGRFNAITDVAGVRVGHVTRNEGASTRTGVTAILPHEGNIFQEKVPAAIYVANGFGKMAGSTQVNELGNLESCIILTNTLSVGRAIDGVLNYLLSLPGNESVLSANPVVGETNDGFLNDIRARVIEPADVVAAVESARGGVVEEGNVGAGTGTRCFGFKGGIGTASRLLPAGRGGYTVGVLAQTNYGGLLTISGAPVGLELGLSGSSSGGDGSCIVVVATDAPLLHRNLLRLARRAMLGLGRTGSSSSNGSGDYVIAFSTAREIRIKHQSDAPVDNYRELRNDAISPLFQAVVEATEEAVYNSLFRAESMTGYQGRKVEALPLEKVREILKKHRAIE